MDYFTDIEGHFAMRRGTPFVLSAKDWMLMKGWFDAGIPLPVVIEAIDTVFEKNEASGRRKVISSLSYCRHAVKELWAERRELTVGDGGTTPELDTASRLEMLASDLAASPHPLVQGSATSVRDLISKGSVPAIEEGLMELEQQLIAQLLETLPAEAHRTLEEQIGRLTAGAAQMDEKTRRRTHEANLRRSVREQFGLPRLTLFG